MTEEVTQEEATTNDLDALENELATRAQREVDELYSDIWKVAEEQGIVEDVRKAVAEFGEDDVYFGSIMGKLYAFRPIYDDEWMDAVAKAQSQGKSPDEALTSKQVSEMCVVAGLNNVVGKRARNGVYHTIAERISQVSGWASDFPANINPKATRPSSE